MRASIGVFCGPAFALRVQWESFQRAATGDQDLRVEMSRAKLSARLRRVYSEPLNGVKPVRCIAAVLRLHLLFLVPLQPLALAYVCML